MANHDNERWSPYASVYDPIRVGNIDGSDTVVHDKAVLRASNVVYRPNPKLKNDPKATLFVGRLDLEVTEEDLEKVTVYIDSNLSCCESNILFRSSANMVL